MLGKSDREAVICIPLSQKQLARFRTCEKAAVPLVRICIHQYGFPERWHWGQAYIQNKMKPIRTRICRGQSGLPPQERHLPFPANYGRWNSITIWFCSLCREWQIVSVNRNTGCQMDEALIFVFLSAPPHYFWFDGITETGLWCEGHIYHRGCRKDSRSGMRPICMRGMCWCELYWIAQGLRQPFGPYHK